MRSTTKPRKYDSVAYEMATAAGELSSSENQFLLQTETNCISASSTPTTPESEVTQNNNESHTIIDEKQLEEMASDADCHAQRAQHKLHVDAELSRTSSKLEIADKDDAPTAPDAVVDLLSTVDGYFSGSRCCIPTSLYGTPLTTVVEAVYSNTDLTQPPTFAPTMPLPETTNRNGLKETVV